jgi:hypothetical protein
MSKLTGMPNGRPLLFGTVEDMKKKIDEYFNSCYRVVEDDKGNKNTENIRPLTITGLALALDTNRETLLNYGNKEEFFDTVRAAKLKIQNFAEENLFTNRNASGIIFNLKNNYGWADRIETDNINHNYNQDITALSDADIDAEIEKYN